MGFFDLSDPQSALPLLGLLQGLGQAAAPSRTPVPFGSVIGQAAQGYMGGQQAAQQQQSAALDIEMKKAQADRQKWWTDYIAKRQAAAAPVAATVAAERPAAPTTAGAEFLPKMQGAILGQESGNNSNIGTSVDGAVGPGQIIPSTFAKWAKSGEAISNPADNRAVSQRIMQAYAQQFGNDPARMAVAYFSGPDNVAPAGSPTPWIHDRHDGNGKTVSSYVSDIMGRLQAGQPAMASAQPAQAPQADPNDPFASMSPSLMRMLGPDDAARLALQQKQRLSPEEVKAAGLPDGTLAERDSTGHVDVINKPQQSLRLSPEEVKAAGLPTGTLAERNPTGHIDVINKPTHWTSVPQSDWAQFGVDPKIVPKGTTIQQNDNTGQYHIQYPPAGSTSNLTPEAVNQGAYYFLTNGKFSGTARSRGDQTAIANRLAELKPPDMSESDWQYVLQNKLLTFKAKTAAAGRVATAQALTAVNEGTVNNSINILSNLLPTAVSQGRFTDVNEFEQWLGRKQNDPNAANLKNAIDSISNEYARVMTGSTTGAPTSDASRAEAAQRILLGYNAGTMPAVLAQMKQEMAGRTAAYANVMNQLSGGQYGGPAAPFSDTEKPFDPKVAPAAVPTAPAPIAGTPAPAAQQVISKTQDEINHDAAALGMTPGNFLFFMRTKHGVTIKVQK